MASEPELPVLPHGSPSFLSGLSESLSFHSSPEAFITSRVLSFRASNPFVANARAPIRAKVLNRNVAVLSSYHHVQQVLAEYSDISCPFSAEKAYDELMAPFFHPPNLLLSDLPSHGPMREVWNRRMETLMASSMDKCHTLALAHFRGINSGSIIDIYESMKALAWKLLLSIFLSSSEDSSSINVSERDDLAEIEGLQETLLRGQFSLFPVSINARLWRSPRSKGLHARSRLASLLRHCILKSPNECPFAGKDPEQREDIANHQLLFTSSLAAKALASLLTAVFLNLFAYQGQHASESTLAEKLKALSSEDERNSLLRSICLETERLSPPVVGIMRQTTQDVVLKSSNETTTGNRTLVPRGWDVWLYFVGAARDPAFFGSSAETFTPDRYCTSSAGADEAKEGFAFGAGPKACLGKSLVREMVITIAKTCLAILPGSETQDSFILHADGRRIPLGVRAWLGWESDIKPEQWAKDMKQLPTQRPAKGVKVTLIRDHADAEPADDSELEFYDAQEYI
ncbi:cytochrome p450 [Physcia stellaris]|nr:cytochrome p450 [Physcia stellaris]